MTEQQFLRQIKRLLHCKADKKREILRQIESDIASAKEGGKSWEEIRQEWGTPEQFVSEFNEDGRDIKKGKRIPVFWRDVLPRLLQEQRLRGRHRVKRTGHRLQGKLH